MGLPRGNLSDEWERSRQVPLKLAERWACPWLPQRGATRAVADVTVHPAQCNAKLAR